jgi:2-polyprenyl-3-methyl-5-hydroxy-6-metoxy-1,4-benzoquinol methylase
MMVGRDYQYPDLRDKIAAEMIRKIELYSGYWSDSEKNIIDIIKILIKKRNVGKRFLDAGCGDGRLIPVFEEQFAEVVAIEPDIERLKVAESLASDPKLSKKITFKRATIEDFDDFGQFDLILCSHVLQHVRTDAVPIIIKKFKNLIKKNGLLCITTCHSTTDKGYFVRDLMRGSQPSEEPIKQEEFNIMTNSIGALPIHFFKLNEISQLLSDNGFKIIEYRVFHLDKRIPGMENEKEIDNAANSDPDLQKRTGRDMLIAAVPML